MNHIERIYDGENQWWKYLLVIVFGFFGGQALGLMPAIILVAGKSVNDPSIDFSEITDLTQVGYSKNVSLIMLLMSFVMMLIISVLLVKWLHKRNFAEITNGTKQIRWQRVKYSFYIWFLISAFITIISYFIDPENFKFQFEISNFAFLLIISIILIPLQTTAEEFFFRGYFFQGVGALTESRLAAAIIPGVIFGLMHFANPEVQEYGFWLAMPHYIISGIVFGIITAVDDGMEIAIGTHAANNLFLAVFLTEKSAVFQTDALIVAKELPLDLLALLVTIFINIVFIIVLNRKYKFNWSNLFAKIKKPVSN